MEFNINYEVVNEKHVSEAANLVLSAYDEERNAIPFLPDGQEALSYLEKLIGNLFNIGSGLAAVSDGKLVGFLAGFELKEFFGLYKGAYSPLYGHGAMKKNRSTIYKGLYRHVADLWVKKECMTHAITFFTHDHETINTWFWQGFGLRCVDALREVKPIHANNSSISIIKADKHHISTLADVHRDHTEYYSKSPIFMPKSQEDPIKDLTEWLEKEEHHLWVAYRDGEPLGYMRIQPNGETFISEHKSVMNITGAFVVERERESGIGAMLLGAIQKWLEENGYPLCGVDFESFNIAGSSFWNKHFTPYTYSLVRRIDERVIS